jgi:hypothetical protein
LSRIFQSANHNNDVRGIGDNDDNSVDNDGNKGDNGVEGNDNSVLLVVHTEDKDQVRSMVDAEAVV